MKGTEETVKRCEKTYSPKEDEMCSQHTVSWHFQHKKSIGHNTINSDTDEFINSMTVFFLRKKSMSGPKQLIATKTILLTQ